jgi:hypothetical protein
MLSPATNYSEEDTAGLPRSRRTGAHSGCDEANAAKMKPKYRFNVLSNIFAEKVNVGFRYGDGPRGFRDKIGTHRVPYTVVVLDRQAVGVNGPYSENIVRDSVEGITDGKIRGEMERRRQLWGLKRVVDGHGRGGGQERVFKKGLPRVIETIGIGTTSGGSVGSTGRSA